MIERLTNNSFIADVLLVRMKFQCYPYFIFAVDPGNSMLRRVGKEGRHSL